jgi:lipopolysaccharide/colanic/teichoic acid biosynthesis glycosyltransferase
MFKRMTDLSIALALTAVAAPLMALVWALVRATSEGPAVYTQVRLGKGRRRFSIYKFRTMYHDCERLSGPKWSTDGDPRVTPLGRFLRKTHLDELPQLWNVLRGEMSLVGPRPERPEFVSDLEAVLPGYAARMSVSPGVTGLAQVNLPPDSDYESVRRKLVYDLYYVDHVGVFFDLGIIACTVFHLAGAPSPLIHRLLGLPDDGRFPAPPRNPGRDLVPVGPSADHEILARSGTA